MKSFASEVLTSGSGLATTPGPPPSPTSRNISELGTSSYSQDLSSSHGQNAPPAGTCVSTTLSNPNLLVLIWMIFCASDMQVRFS